MLINFNKITNTLPLLKLEAFLNTICLYLKSVILLSILKVLKYHFKYQFKILTCISGIDYVDNRNRFIVTYEILSIKFNNRLRLKIIVNEAIAIQSIKTLYLTAIWWEDEIWDMLGVMFLKRKNLIRLLSDYGFQGFPLKKDFPLSGFVDIKYNLITNKIQYDNIELTQNYRVFNYQSPWC
jgi:NADH:ubiquinone oxidoreductase subunit C